MTKKYLSILSLLAAGTPGLAQQQQQMYVCQADTCHVFSLEHTNGIVFRADSFQIGQLPAYATARVDSITFSEPPLAVVPLGWWGNMANGQCSYRSLMDIRLQKDDVCTLVVFTMECRDSICLAARCELYFDDEEIAQAFVLSEGESEDVQPRAAR
ncbi:MAG: hypothetical protein IJ841_08270 [Prevotella sp.]|nr:hypothetical protein [Prevotella sp.]